MGNRICFSLFPPFLPTFILLYYISFNYYFHLKKEEEEERLGLVLHIFLHNSLATAESGCNSN
jgi:hypothetical protein